MPGPDQVLELVDISDKPVLARLFQLYLYDASVSQALEPDNDGRFAASVYFDAYWTESTRAPYFIVEEGKRIGFALVRQVAPGCHCVAEFFVLRAARRRGVGRRAALAVFAAHRGQWRVAQDARNKSAQVFWRAVIDAFTAGAFEERVSPSQPAGVEQRFESPATPELG